MRHLIWIVLFLVITVLIGNGTLSLADDFIEIDAVVNITSQGGVAVATTQDVENAVAKANEILKQAKIRIKSVKVNGPTSAGANAGNDDGDSSFNRDERDKAREQGGKELDSAVGAGKGIKITLGGNPQDGNAANPGISIHENRCAICRNRATSQLSGETIAHEIGHILTLTALHTITATQSADAGGHSSDPNNFMNPSDTRTGTNITSQQAEEMRKKAKELGRTVTQPAASAPAATQPHGAGGRQDERRDAFNLVPPAGLNYMQAYHLGGDASMSLFFTLEAALDPLQPAQWRYLWLFDTDNNPLTGITMMGVQGVERGVVIQLNAPGNGTFGSTVQFQGFTGGGNFSLAPAKIVNELEFDLTNNPQPGETSFRVFAPYPNFGTFAPVSKIYLLSIDPFVNQVVDTITTDYINDFEADKAFVMVNPPLANPGQMVLFSGFRFTPFSTAQAYVDNSLLPLPLVVGPTGGVNGSLIVPPSTPPPVGGFYFVTVIDAEGRSGFNVINVAAVPMCGSGDMNHDSFVNVLDIDPFAQAILHAPAISADDACNADTNHDGAVNGLDIDPFVAILTGS